MPEHEAAEVAPNSDRPIILLSHGHGVATATDPTPARLLDRNPAPVRDALEQVIRVGS